MTQFTKQNEKKGGEERMKKMIVIGLVMGIAVGLMLLANAQADVVDPSQYKQTTISWTDFKWDKYGRLEAQSSYSETNGFTDLAATSYYYTIKTKINFEIINGEAYEANVDSDEWRSKNNPATSTEEKNDYSETKISTITTYNRIKDHDEGYGCLKGAEGKRQTRSWAAAEDTSMNGAIEETEKQERNYTEENLTLTFTFTNGELEVTRENGTRFTYDKADKKDLLSETPDLNTTRQYLKIQGTNKLTQTVTNGTTTYKNQGAYRENGTDKSPFTLFTQTTSYAYDAKGNVLPAAGIVRNLVGTKEIEVLDKESGKIKKEEVPIYKYYFDLDGGSTYTDKDREITDSNKDGSIIDEMQAGITDGGKEIKLSGSYTITTSMGTGKGSQDQWVDFSQNEITPLEVINAMAVPDWTHSELSQTPRKAQ